MPLKPAILSTLIAVTFIQPNNKPQYPFPKELHVCRRIVFKALGWLKVNNPLWEDIYINEDRLRLLPVYGVPMEIVKIARVSHEMEALAQEETGHVPNLLDTDNTMFEDLYPKVDEVNLMGDNSMNDHYRDDNISSDDIILHLNRMVDANDLREHVLSNEALPPIASDVSEERFCMKRGSRFVSEYGRTSDSGLRTDGGPSNPNHLLGAFPVLVPYGIGGFETA
ncbi:hypothetical protein IW262DRAFT_1302023 [Armillaria fumosa]|nr:hypothetical protein IW262DRAFT_1302023 [Armillaria fumosa]